MKRTALAAALAFAMVTLTACDTSPGVVTGKTHAYSKNPSLRYQLSIRHDKTGNTVVDYVTEDAYKKCDKGDRWPECAQ